MDKRPLCPRAPQCPYCTTLRCAMRVAAAQQAASHSRASLFVDYFAKGNAKMALVSTLRCATSEANSSKSSLFKRTQQQLDACKHPAETRFCVLLFLLSSLAGLHLHSRLTMPLYLVLIEAAVARACFMTIQLERMMLASRSVAELSF